MNTQSLHTSVELRAPTPARSGRFWPAFIVALLCANAVIVGVTLYFAMCDTSVATEPNYYFKALNYNDTIRQRGENARLGWRAVPTLRPTPHGGPVELVVRLESSSSEPVSDVTLTAVAFSSVRSSQRQTLALRPVSPGEYATPITIDRPGAWCLILTARRGDDVFTSEREVIAPDLSR